MERSFQHEKGKEFNTICSFNPRYSRYHAFQEGVCIIFTTWHSRKYKCTYATAEQSPAIGFICMQPMQLKGSRLSAQTRAFLSNSICNQQPINWFEFSIQSGLGIGSCIAYERKERDKEQSAECHHYSHSRAMSLWLAVHVVYPLRSVYRPGDL